MGAAALSFVRDAPGFLAERLVPLAVMRRRKVVLLGGSSDSAAVVLWLCKAPFRLPFNEPTGDYAIVEQTAGGRTWLAYRGRCTF